MLVTAICSAPVHHGGRPLACQNLFSEGIAKGRITPERFVALTATNPAKLFGMCPRKGTIAIGADAT
ncbi:hypothetical protein ACHFJ0_04130 [Paracoccus sp. NGMCC 1.201697]|uniref:Amidohydrolase-related domain-containing protein n=1 Tax=Paracoccus broussonetiae subsp. drimophilus TaxID=3373869 RepID=A0ABW7LGW8_9RHOB